MQSEIPNHHHQVVDTFLGRLQLQLSCEKGDPGCDMWCRVPDHLLRVPWLTSLPGWLLGGRAVERSRQQMHSGVCSRRRARPHSRAGLTVSRGPVFLSRVAMNSGNSDDGFRLSRALPPSDFLSFPSSSPNATSDTPRTWPGLAPSSPL